jgi:hypothetical protein
LGTVVAQKGRGIGRVFPYSLRANPASDPQFAYGKSAAAFSPGTEKRGNSTHAPAMGCNRGFPGCKVLHRLGFQAALVFGGVELVSLGYEWAEQVGTPNATHVVLRKKAVR